MAPNIGHERISQVWFAGMHANVGGGYPDDGLAHVALGWVMDQAELNGLRLEPQIRDELKAMADDNAPLYDSRHGLAGYYRYNPRRIEALVQRNRLRIGPVKVHESVLRRIQAGTDGYAPITLPPGFAVVTIAGDIVDGDTYLRGRTPGGGAAGGAPVPAAAALAPASTAWVGRESTRAMTAMPWWAIRRPRCPTAAARCTAWTRPRPAHWGPIAPASRQRAGRMTACCWPAWWRAPMARNSSMSMTASRCQAWASRSTPATPAAAGCG